MDSNRWLRIEEVFNAAIGLSPDERERFLDSACAREPDVRSEVSSLLQEVEHEDDFLSQPAFTLGARLLHSASFELVDGQTFAGYLIVKPLGRGGMGSVFLAEDPRLQRLVALKLLPVSLTGDAGNIESALRFQQEARAASAISHPNVAHIYEFGRVEDRHYLAMEFVEGKTLRSLLKEGSMNLGRALDIALQVAQGLQAAHEAGVVHRDIKPENIMVRRDGYVKVLDFGLAKLTTSGAQVGEYNRTRGSSLDTTPGLIMGTTVYMSPEQVRGDPVDPRTDVWSWGVVLYEMLAGRPPFIGATTSDIIAEVLKAEPLLTEEDSVVLPRSLQLILRTALRKKPEERYDSIGGAIKDVSDTRQGIDYARIAGLPLPLATGGPGRTAARRGRAPQWSRFKLPAMIGAGLLISALAVLFFGLVLRPKVQPASRISPLQITRLTTDGRVMDAAISGDGRLMAYVPITDGKQSLWIQNLDSGEKRQLSPPDPALCWGLRFTLNGQDLFYITTQPGSTVSVLYRVALAGGPSKKLVVNIDAPLALSPDGMQIAFVRSFPGQHRDALVVANVDGSAEREITSRQHPDTFSFSGASWSPDGKLIALGASRSNELEFALLGIPLDGGSPVELTPWQWTAFRGAAWRNDGRSLILSARAAGTKEVRIWRLSYPGGQAEPITTAGDDYEEISLAQNAPALVTTQTDEISSIWIGSPATPRRVTEGRHEGADGLVVTANGSIVYAVGKNEQSNLWTMGLDGANKRQLTDNEGVLPTASLDARFIAYVSTQGGAHHIWIMNSDGSNKKQLTNGGGEEYPSISPDGNWVFYASMAHDRGTLWKVPTSGGQPVQLTSTGITIKPVVSPDGTKIACTYRADESDKWKTALLSIKDGALLQTLPLPYPYNQIIRWTEDSKALTYLDKREGVHNIWRQPLDGSAATQLTKFSADLIFQYAWLNHGAQLVLSRGRRTRDIVLIRNL